MRSTSRSKRSECKKGGGLGCATEIKLTLGLKEITLLNTDLDRLVELAIKGILGSRRKLVVGLDVFLDRLTAVMKIRWLVCDATR
jgi:hypothetical protein